MSSDGLDLELATMQNIATALARLDAPARARVLVWLQLRVDADAVLAQPPDAAAGAATTVAPLRMVSIPTPIADYDDTLSVDSLGELFDDPVARPLADPVRPPATGVLAELVAQFQNLAHDWDKGCDTGADEVRTPRALPAAS